MSCAMSHDRLWAFVHNEDEDASARAEVASHINSCAICRDQVAEMRDILGELDQIGLAPRAAQPARLPERINDYRIIRRIGQGGMGVVYEAEQKKPLRRVALKLVLGGVHADELRIRMFEREVQALARLSHAGIAAIYEAGRTDDGQSYYAMELVEGTDLLEHCWPRTRDGSKARISLKERLNLFLAVCDAIAYAHQRGIIHRDLKPSNILVTAEGRPKILDFGLARAIESNTPISTLNTASGRLMGTLPYMSPEQAQGLTEAIDVRTDVYALGVILYELLLGRLPYDVGTHSLLQSVKVICEQQPDSPSRVDRTMPVDLAVISLKALEKEPQRRYQSVAEMSEDIGRFLSGHPITARRPTTVYQLRKFVSRHRVPVTLAMLLIAGLIGASAWIYLDSIRETQRIRRLNEVLIRFWGTSNPWEQGSKKTTVYDAVKDAATKLDTELHDEPLVAAALHNTIGNLFRGFGEYESADHHLRAALELRRNLIGRDHVDTAETMRNLGENLVESIKNEGDEKKVALKFREAEEAFLEALAIVRSHFSPPHERIAVNLNNLGLVMKATGRLGPAREYYLDALTMRRTILERLVESDRALQADLNDAKRNLAETLNNLGTLARQEKKFDYAQGYLQEAIRLRTEACGENHPDVAKSLNNYGKLLYDLQLYPQAEQHFRKTLAILSSESNFEQDHLFVPIAMHSLALSLRRQPNKLDEAIDMCQRALEVRLRLLKPNHFDIAESHDLLGQLLLEKGDAEGAKKQIDAAREIRAASQSTGDL